MLLATVAIVFAALVLLSMPIVFALGVAGIAGLWIAGYPMQQLSSALVSGSQSWVLLSIPAFVFAANLMQRARTNDGPVASRQNTTRVGRAAVPAAVAMVVPCGLLAGFSLGMSTATEAGAVVAGSASRAAKLYYRNISWRVTAKSVCSSAKR